jgi:cytochrome c oxidase accessory protein FixG
VAVSFELHPERLATTDETGRRVYLHPADVKGKWRSRRTVVQAVLLAIFLVLPWVRIAGRQALLLDVAHREFEIFGLSLRAHNAPLLFLVFGAFVFGLFFVTSVWGRIWCGWACPQTVFIDSVFRRIERWIEGSALERKKLDAQPLDAKKLAKRTAKWSLFTLASLVITHSLLAYFVGTEHLATMMCTSPLENWGSFLFMAITTGIILFDFGWFREQFCIIACPYGRFQSVMMDSHSTVVAYDEKRGEPRHTPQAKVLAKTHGGKLGDCVNCYRCVQVCPVGIDIRRGVQMECIACTGCIDACDDVMTKLKKPTGLIRYDSMKSMRGEKRKVVRPRSAIYLAASLACVLLLAGFLSASQKLDVVVLRAKEAPYTVDSSGPAPMVNNHFKLELSNQTSIDRELDFVLPTELVPQGFQVITAIRPLPVSSGTLKRVDVFVRFPSYRLAEGQKKIVLLIQSRDTSGTTETIEKEITLVGPLK